MRLQLMRQIRGERSREATDQGDARRTARQKFISEPSDGLCRFFDKRMTMAIAKRCGSKDARCELRIIARQSMARPVGESIAVAIELAQKLFEQRRGGNEIVEAQCRTAQGAAADDGTRTLIAQGKAETADPMTLSPHEGEARRSGAGNDNAAISSVVGAETGRMGIDVDADRGEGPQSLPYGGGCFFGYGAGETKADMHVPAVVGLQSCLCESLRNGGKNSRNGRIQVRIEIGKAARCLATESAILPADTDPALGAAAIDPHEKPVPSHAILLKPGQYQNNTYMEENSAGIVLVFVRVESQWWTG
jgi:hypothetical protein